MSESIPCPKCLGSKRFEKFSHIAYGDCFTCGGAGVVDARKVADYRPAFPMKPIRDGVYGVACTEGPGRGQCGGGFFDFDGAAEHRDALRREHRSDAYVVMKVVDGRWRTRSGDDLGVAQVPA